MKTEKRTKFYSSNPEDFLALWMKNLPMPIRGLRSEAYKTGQAVFDNDFMNSLWVEYMPDGHVELRNVLFAPLNIEGKTAGIIGLANKAEDFTEDDLRIASAFGQLAAIALKNSRTMEALVESKAIIEAAHGQLAGWHRYC